MDDRTKGRFDQFRTAEFVVKLKARDGEAVEAIVRAYTEQLLRAALGLGFDESRADELAQSVWVTFFDVLEKFEGRSHIRTFLFGILYHKASEMRREQLRVEPTDAIEEIVDDRFDETGHWSKPPVSPEAFLGATQTMSIIERCLEALPVVQKSAFLLKEVEEEETPEICSMLGVTVTNLGVLLFRARNRLRECVEAKSGSVRRTR